MPRATKLTKAEEKQRLAAKKQILEKLDKYGTAMLLEIEEKRNAAKTAANMECYRILQNLTEEEQNMSYRKWLNLHSKQPEGGQEQQAVSGLEQEKPKQMVKAKVIKIKHKTKNLTPPVPISSASSQQSNSGALPSLENIREIFRAIPQAPLGVAGEPLMILDADGQCFWTRSPTDILTTISNTRTKGLLS